MPQSEPLGYFLRGLTVAAPDLYAALTELWEAVNEYKIIGHEGSRLMEAMSDARAALAKARGEQTPDAK